MAVALSRIARIFDGCAQPAHRAFDPCSILFGRQSPKPLLGRHLDIDRQPVSKKTGLMRQFRIGIRDRLEMNITAKVMLFPQRSGNAHQLFHRIIGRSYDPGGQEKSLDIIAPVKAQRQFDHFAHSEARPANVARPAIDAIVAIKDTTVRQQNLEQRYASSVRCVGMADAHAFGRTQAAHLP